MYVSYIRKIDELGRIVIPKEIRTKLKIQENENILIELNDEKISIAKYSFLSNYQKFINELCNQVIEIYHINIIIKDQEKEIFNNYTEHKKYQFEELIIKESINLGRITIYSDYEEGIKNLIKLIARILTIYLENL